MRKSVARDGSSKSSKSSEAMKKFPFDDQFDNIVSIPSSRFHHFLTRFFSSKKPTIFMFFLFFVFVFFSYLLGGNFGHT